MTPLMWAVNRRQVAFVKLLLDGGANVSIVNGQSQTALMFADDGTPECNELLGLLLAKAAEPQVLLIKDWRGRTLIDEAKDRSQSGKTAMFELRAARFPRSFIPGAMRPVATMSCPTGWESQRPQASYPALQRCLPRALGHTLKPSVLTMPSISNALASFADPKNAEQLRHLDELISQVAPEQCGEEELRSLFMVFERFPEEDGYGVFWSILHLLEACNGCDEALVESVKRKPVEFNVRMLNRLLNSGTSQVGETSLIELLASIAEAEGVSPSVRKSANGFLAYQAAGGGLGRQAS